MTIAKDIWFAYVINHIFEKSKQLAEERCNGCKLKLKSSILHEHEQITLLEKIETYLSEIRGNLLGYELENLFKRFSHQEKNVKTIYVNRYILFLENEQVYRSPDTPESFFLVYYTGMGQFIGKLRGKLRLYPLTILYVPIKIFKKIISTIRHQIRITC